LDQIDGSSLLELLNATVLVCETEGSVVYANAAALSLLGVGRDELVGHSFPALVASSEPPLPVTGGLWAVPQAGLANVMLSVRAGKHAAADMVADVRLSQATKGPLLVLTLRVQDDLLLQDLCSALTDGVCVLRDDRVLYANPALLRMLGQRDAQALAGQSAAELVELWERPRLLALLASEQASPLLDFSLRRADQKKLVATVGLRAARGNLRYALFFDKSAQKELEHRLAQADRTATMGTLAAGIAHEINNPLAYALGSLELALQRVQSLPLEQLSAAAVQAVDTIDHCVRNARDGVDRIRIVVRDFSTVSRPSIETSDGVDPEEVLDAAINLAWNEIRHRARLVKDLQKLPRVVGDSARLGQVFLNLLVNAAQALSERTDANNEIRVRGRQQGEVVVVEVEDNGPGIADEIQDRVFEPFFTTKPPEVGSGLGLSICHGIITSLGGAITLRSHPGGGSCFRVELPLAPAAAATQAPPDSQLPGRRSRILVIDDEPLLGHTLRLAFQDYHEVEVATSGRQGLAMLDRDSHYGMILCDLMMPDMSGIDVYERLAERQPQLLPRFVFITGGAFSDRARMFLQDNSVARIHKPFTIEEVESLLRDMSSPRDR
jgi:signal transduction histidine kinase/ActR/RegA family two-component response regulator